GLFPADAQPIAKAPNPQHPFVRPSPNPNQLITISDPQVEPSPDDSRDEDLLETRTTQLEEQHKRLASKPSALEGAKKEHENLGRDAERFLEYIAKLQEAKKKSEKFNEALK
ncbi:hypothetical protein PTTG_29966, partial [Puccinia triticina 1-1 BBBD Race 1]